MKAFVVTSALVLLLGITGRFAAMQEGILTLKWSIILDLITTAGVVCLAAAFAIHRKRKKQTQQMEQACQEARSTTNQPPIQGVPGQRN